MLNAPGRSPTFVISPRRRQRYDRHTRLARKVMAGQQPEPRITVDLPVRIWGMSADGHPFNQHVHAQNVSSDGALLTGVDSELKVGDVIGIQCDDKKSRCTVVWVMNTGPIKKNQVGIKLVADQDCPWKT